MAYQYFQPNPCNKSVGDCVIRALCKAFDDDWHSVYSEVTLQGYIVCDMPSSNATWGRLLKEKGYKRYAIPNTCPDCYTIEDFCNDNPEGTYILCTGSHVVTAIDGTYDSWQSGREVVVFYYREEKTMPNPNYQQYLLPYMQYPYPVPMQSQQAQPQQSQAQQPSNQIQNTGFIMVRSEDEAYNYPVAPGNCVTFKVENEPIVLEKSMSFSQLETPRIDRYRLVREDIIEPPKPMEEVEVIDMPADEIKGEIQALRHEIEEIRDKLFSQPKSSARKRDVDDE